MDTLVSMVRRLADSPIPAAWSLAAAFLAICSLTMSAYLWKTRAPLDPVEATLARLESVDAPLRERVCAHRANNVPKYRAARQAFNCIEIDVVLVPPAGGAPAVYHPPHDNHHGLTLEFLLANEAMPAGKLWLDVKDLGEGTWTTLLELLSGLIPPERRADTIIETGWADPSVRSAALAFREKGFLFSYYLPTEEALACGSERSASCDELREQVLLTTSMGFSHLSFDARNRVFLQSIRDRMPASVRLLTWDLSQSWPQPGLIDEVDVYIVKFPVPYST